MSMGMFSILPLLKGWEYKTDAVLWDVNPSRGAAPTDMPEFRGLGWLQELTWIATDLYAQITIRTRSGKSTELKPMFDMPVWMATTGPWSLPLGMTRFVQPSRTSTICYAELYLFSGVMVGSTLPFLDRTMISAKLGSESTQDSCTVAVSAPCVLITDVVQFVKSLRAVEGNRNMLVQHELLEYAEQFVVER